MKVKDVMMGTPASCRSSANLAAAVEILWNRNCGILPVLNAEEKVVGIVTDRDICIALGTRNKLAADLTAGQVASEEVVSCKAEDDILTAIEYMAEAKVRRLPVVDAQGKLQGILSMDDIVLHANRGVLGRRPELSNDEVIDALKRVYRVNLPQVERPKAARA
jgi:CBS domain-containing protein